ncbi:MAG: dihydrolipoyl dehydrogenase [Anaeromicrobium sp.]|jgi:dihydrolipoamide dehydrogenase|uniref:dihydrolipoyl dehydrogenase n=1 Tax=Anaeromicrobium sp. TaxID=1929132 RepID=UPI0025CFEC10|nr:dihydrolipoyl dehydrogenase [Anaeromicrobium sp.]MCT4593924.1 dihydrolipoyl dehydrogenase [Anaeromicrobium sp.]
MEYDVIVIGAGPAGYVAAIKASQLGGKVALVEKNKIGGTCLNRGCIPTKTYIKNVEIIESIKKAKYRGINLLNETFNLDMKKIVKYKNNVVFNLTSGVHTLLKSYKVDIYTGKALIKSPSEVLVKKQILKAKAIIYGGGSKVAKIPIKGIDSPLVLTSDTILDLEEIPNKLCIIGGGVIGVEMAEIFNAYGTKVTIVEMCDRILPNGDYEISEYMKNILSLKGIKIITGTQVKNIVEENNKLRLILPKGEELICDKALLSVGRVSDLEGIGNIGIKTERGKILVDDYMETNIKNIYAPGDVNGKLMLAHSAFKMGEVAAQNAMGQRVKLDLKYTPSSVYTTTEVAFVGLREDEAKEDYHICVGKFKFNGNGRALASGHTEGFVKVIGDKKYKEILGIHIIGPCASEIINEGATLMASEVTLEEVAHYIHGHPSYSEALMEACADALGKSIHLPKK